jgi:hypothetical protein
LGSGISASRQVKENFQNGNAFSPTIPPSGPFEVLSVMQPPSQPILFPGKVMEPVIQAKYQLDQEKSNRLQESYEANMRVSG